jgi:iron(III) transport system substrate-binding protein
MLLGLLVGCTEDKATGEKEVWIYTSMYKDTIADLTPRLKKAFPDVKVNWYQAGSEDIATKVNAEILAGNLQADVLISSDRFWYEEMANNQKLLAYKPKVVEQIPNQLRHDQGFYHALSLPVMVLCYNNEAIKENEAPKTFKELAEPKWKDKFTTGSPLASGTNFTTMAMIQHHYGWEYFKALKNNNTIAQGGNSSVLRRIQSKERPVGWVLLENVLRFQGKDERLKVIYPEDGAVTHANVMAITNKDNNRDIAKKIVDWMFGQEGQEAMTRSYMYSPLKAFAPPKGAPEFSKILANSFEWSRKIIEEITQKRVMLKEEYSKIMFE